MPAAVWPAVSQAMVHRKQASSRATVVVTLCRPACPHSRAVDSVRTDASGRSRPRDPGWGRGRLAGLEAIAPGRLDENPPHTVSIPTENCALSAQGASCEAPPGSSLHGPCLRRRRPSSPRTLGRWPSRRARRSGGAAPRRRTARSGRRVAETAVCRMTTSSLRPLELIRRLHPPAWSPARGARRFIASGAGD